MVWIRRIGVGGIDNGVRDMGMGSEGLLGRLRIFLVHGETSWSNHLLA